MQGILSNDLPQPSDMLDSKSVQTFKEQELSLPSVSTIDYGELESLVYFMQTQLYMLNNWVKKL